MADENLERMLALLHPQVIDSRIDSRLLFLSRYETQCRQVAKRVCYRDRKMHNDKCFLSQ